MFACREKSLDGVFGVLTDYLAEGVFYNADGVSGNGLFNSADIERNLTDCLLSYVDDLFETDDYLNILELEKNNCPEKIKRTAKAIMKEYALNNINELRDDVNNKLRAYENDRWLK